jgi:hypothetical protein
VDSLKAEPLLYKLPNLDEEATMNEEMVVSFLDLIVKRAISAIISTTPSQTIRRPKPILQGEPSMVLDLRRCPSFPNNLIDARVNKSKKL